MMARLLGLAFAALLVGELTLLAVVVGLLAYLPYLLWQSSPVRAVLALLGLACVIGALWRAHQAQARAASQRLPGPPEISISRIPITGAPGALYMLQFLVWALVTPSVGFLYAALLAGALLVFPVVVFVNRPGRRRSVGGALLGALTGLAVVSFVSFREVPIMGVFGVALGTGLVAGPCLIWMRSRRSQVSIAPYTQRDVP
jgi:hypothetical protein